MLYEVESRRRGSLVLATNSAGVAAVVSQGQSEKMSDEDRSPYSMEVGYLGSDVGANRVASRGQVKMRKTWLAVVAVRNRVEKE